MRFNEFDIKLLVKERGTAEPYRALDLKEIEKEIDLPQFDHSIIWRKKIDRHPLRKMSPVKEPPQIPSLGLRRGVMGRVEQPERNSKNMRVEGPTSEKGGNMEICSDSSI